MRMQSLWMSCLAAALSLACAATLPSCGKGDDKAGGGGAGDPIKIGSLNSTSGTTSDFGISTDNGIRLAADEQNAKGGILGRKIEIALGNTESLASKAPSAILKLIEQDKVCAVIGEVSSGITNAASPEAQRNKIPMLSPSSTGISVTRVGNYIFRSCFTDDFQGAMMAKFTAENLKLMKAAIFVDSKNDYSKGLEKVITQEYGKMGGQVLHREEYAAGDKTFKAQLTNIKGSNPDVIFLPGYYGEAGLIIKQARELGITCPFVGGDGWDGPTLMEEGGAALNGCYYTNHFFIDDPAPKAKEFVAKYTEKYHRAPDAMAVLGYDAANIMFKAIQDAGTTDGPQIRDALAKIKDFPGLTGTITIDENRNARKSVIVVEFEDGKMQLKTRVDP